MYHSLQVLFLVFYVCITAQSVLVEPPVVEPPKCKYKNGLHFNLSNSGINQIPKSFLTSSLVTCISLENNEIDRIDNGAFEDFPNLRYLNLKNNRISNAASFFMNKYPVLETLILDHAIIREKDICDEYQGCGMGLPMKMELPRLKKLYLRRNELEVISWMSMPNLTQLYLSHNLLGTLRFDGGQLENITHLHLSDNRLKILDCAPLHHLEEMLLNNNQITTIINNRYPYRGLRVIENLNLKKLAMQHNQINRIEVGALTHLENLQYLDLSFNALRHFDKNEFITLVKLNTLLLNNNQLEFVPNFSGLKHMELILLNNNFIKIIDVDVFHGLSKLETLMLNNNQLTEIVAGTFDKLSSLQELDLSNNNLVTCGENWISSLTSLRILLLNNNHFDDVAKISLHATNKLEYVNLIDNPFTNITVESLILLADNSVIDVKKEPTR